MLGTVAHSFGDRRWWSCVGAFVAGLAWFPSLGARGLRGVFARPSPWRVLASGIPS